MSRLNDRYALLVRLLKDEEDTEDEDEYTPERISEIYSEIFNTIISPKIVARQRREGLETLLQHLEIQPEAEKTENLDDLFPDSEKLEARIKLATGKVNSMIPMGNLNALPTAFDLVLDAFHDAIKTATWFKENGFVARFFTFEANDIQDMKGIMNEAIVAYEEGSIETYEALCEQMVAIVRKYPIVKLN